MACPKETTSMTARGLLFLLAPEDSSRIDSEMLPAGISSRWHGAKTVFWLAFSITGAILIGQL